MKKLVYLITLMLGVLALSGCSNVQKDLEAIDWYLKTEDSSEDEGTKFVLSFGEKEVKMFPEVERSGNDLTDNFVNAFAEGMTFTYDYTVSGNTLTMKNTELKQEFVLELKKDKKNFKVTEKSFKLDGKAGEENSGFDGATLVAKEKSTDQAESEE